MEAEAWTCREERMKDLEYVVLRVHTLDTARWLSWLERRPVTAEVDGSNPFRVVF